ncbi:MAG: hypothetical protein IT279_11470 [Ignavibacteriaceae bacterium]|nr:hypothetical protein [Ignavibacteriaceae bacterium]
MTKSEIIAEAGRLKAASEKSVMEYEAKSAHLVVLINKHLEARTDIYSLIGQDNLSMMRDNHLNHTKFMTAVMKNFNPQVLVETILWVLRAYKSHGFFLGYWDVQLNGWLGILTAELSMEAGAEILPFYQWMLSYIPHLDKLSSETPGTE